MSISLFAPIQFPNWHYRDPGESPPPAPRNFVGRGELLTRVISLVEAGTPIVLTGPGGIIKTAIGLTLLDNDRIKEKFGINRRLIHCDEVQSYAHFLDRLSEVTGAGISSASMATLRTCFSSISIVLILDNADKILDPHAPGASALYSAIEELSRIRKISLVITTRISTVPITCQQIEISPLSLASAREAFYKIYPQPARPSNRCPTAATWLSSTLNHTSRGGCDSKSMGLFSLVTRMEETRCLLITDPT